MWYLSVIKYKYFTNFSNQWHELHCSNAKNSQFMFEILQVENYGISGGYLIYYCRHVHVSHTLTSQKVTGWYLLRDNYLLLIIIVKLGSCSSLLKALNSSLKDSIQKKRSRADVIIQMHPPTTTTHPITF